MAVVRRVLRRDLLKQARQTVFVGGGSRSSSSSCVITGIRLAGRSGQFSSMRRRLEITLVMRSCWCSR